MVNLKRFPTIKRDYKYYSFIVGLSDDPTLWTLDDVRLPATDFKHALRLYRLLVHHEPRRVKVTYDFSTSPSRVKKVVELEKYKEPSKIIWQFKAIREITVTF
jgi:hypothetical protein